MGYVVRKRGPAKRPWKLAYQSRVGGPHKETHIPAEQWRELGILPDMTLEQVKARVKQLNAQEALKRRGAARQKIDARLKEKNLVHLAYLPAADLEEFEREHLFRRGHDPKLKSHWSAVKDLLCELQIDPADWEYQKTRFYDYFSSKQFSMSYVQKLVPVLNKWGYYQARKYRLPFLAVPFPTGRERFKIDDAYYDKNPSGRAPSPLSPSELEKKRGELKPAQFNWLYLSIWFGLRPEEIDNIARGVHFEIRRVGDETAIAVYQTKLTGLARSERWKLIPVTCKEQELAVETIKAGDIKRPLTKTLTKLFGENVGLRSGRKNFTDMMLDRGHPLEDVSAWLGHRSIQRTWTNYRDRQKLRYTKKAA